MINKNLRKREVKLVNVINRSSDNLLI